LKGLKLKKDSQLLRVEEIINLRSTELKMKKSTQYGGVLQNPTEEKGKTREIVAKKVGIGSGGICSGEHCALNHKNNTNIHLETLILKGFYEFVDNFN
jgi:hypothetical protein